ncbi:uncharacterized protein LOC111434002 [Cucurbita moschata]|uniref:Uncharacterized protein LOC111434002 n=1 Tax=Cucurbita moschata TaxID=3662 RepID=A0A6J1EGN1_CUCMO|nr:uncharacterized protein LOC111434002 [Cucurbita moschata]
MPLDGAKSVVYRSFITCDDPKGVVDCNIIKISKVNSQKLEEKITTHKTSRNQKRVLISQGEQEEVISKEMRERIHGRSSLPFMEILSSKGVRSDSKSKEISKDMLEGTSSLRESLIILARLQEASNKLVRLKMKYQRSFSCHLEDESSPVDVQKSKLSRHGSSRHGSSRHGSSRHGVDEVKKVIRDSLVKRDVTNEVKISGKSCFRDMSSDSGSEIPSTSSSQSSMVNDGVKCCHVSTLTQKNLKRNNLIAKLMGLEEISSRSVQTTPKKEFEFDKIFGYKTSPKSKSVINKEDPEKRTLREILEKMPFNRPTENNSDNELKLHYPHSYNNGSKQRLKDAPPVVLIKPKPLPPNELEEHQTHAPLKEEAFNQKPMLRRSKKKELRPFDDSADFHEGILSSDKLQRKQEAEGISLKPITQEGIMPSKLRTCVVEAKKKAEEKLETSSPMHDMPHEKEPSDKNNLTSTRKLVEKEFAEEKVVSRPQHQEEATSTNPRKNKTHKQRGSIPDSMSGRAVRAISNDHNCQKKEEAVLACSEVNSLTHRVEAKKDDESSDTNESADLPTNQIKVTLMDLITMESEAEECDTKIIECCKESLNSLSPLSPELEIDTSITEVINPNSHTEKEIESSDQGTNLKALLLRSSSLLYHAGELFDLNLNGRTMLQAASRCNDPDTTNPKPFIDCAIELIERKSQVANSLLLGYSSNTKTQISIEKLVEEVCNDIDTLTSYHKNLHVDTLATVLERDLYCKKVMNGTWDFGWKNGFSRSESEEIVNDTEKLILNELIDEFFK